MRSTLHLCQIADEPRRKQVHLQVLDQHIHTNDATGRLLFHMLGAIAQFETELRAERQIDGIKTCQSAWGTVWSPETLTPQQTAALQGQRRLAAPIRTLMKTYRISKAMVYR